MRALDREEPIRGEIYSVERLENEAEALARVHALAARPGPGGRLRRRLRKNAERLFEIHASLSEAALVGETISRGAEWFLDNFHLVTEQLREIEHALPAHYDRELPKLEQGDPAGFPRVYALAATLIRHTDSRLDREGLERFVRSYQAVEPLSMGELWALPIALRAALVENLRRLAGRLEYSRRERAAADRLSERVLAAVADAPKPESREYSARALLEAPENVSLHPSTTFLVRLVHRLRDQDTAISPALRWIEERVAAEGRTFDEAVQEEHQRQTTIQATIGNVMESMRLLSSLPWGEFFEAASPVEALLRQDPAGVYPDQDFATRDRYRHAIEELGRHDGRREAQVARVAAALARDRHEPVERHVGYFLVGEGRPELERTLGWRVPPGKRLGRLAHRHSTFLYLASIALLCFVFLAGLAGYAGRHQASGAIIAAAVILAAIPSSELAVHLVNFFVPLLARPRLLPKLEFKEGIPEQWRTLVAVPCLLTDEVEVRELIERLEIRSLANPDANLHFALLSDFVDSPTEIAPSDGPLLETARTGIASLNERYSAPSESPHPEGTRFFLFHRRRSWNPADRTWMGWERKRGKLVELNRLLRGRGPTTFSAVVGDTAILPSIRYVLTLDADTKLSRDTARRLVGALSHPLNRPRLDPATGRVIAGYGILQPRVSVSLESAHRSIFSEVSSGHTGIDPYTTAASNIYQDIFGEGSFTGKALYDVDAFEASLAGRIPENTLLSHDLLEGCFARSGLASDIEIFEDHPSSFDVYTQRQHRWTRGDWQVVRWLFPKIPSENGSAINDLSVISRWKILDNIRRSLVAPAMLLFLIAGWLFLPGSPLFWSGAVLLTIAFPIVFHLAEGLTVHPRGIPWTSHFWSVWGDASDNLARLAVRIIFLPHLAGISADAAARALYRQLFSRRGLLDWTTAAAAETTRARGFKGYLRRMWRGEVFVLLVGAAVFWMSPGHALAASPLLALWLAAPAAASRISRPGRAAPAGLPKDQRLRLRERARQTWRFFEMSVTGTDHDLPPDNWQDDRDPKLAHRTSPTNIGLYLLSTIAAYDFGYLGTEELIERLERTFETLERLPRYQGHFFNWYDTSTLTAMAPQYVSTVDSGNLAACLLALKQACADLGEGSPSPAAVRDGLSDVLRLVNAEISRLPAVGLRTDAVTVRELLREFGALSAELEGFRAADRARWLLELDSAAAALGEGASVLAQEHPELGIETARAWIATFRRQVRSHQRDQEFPANAGARLARLSRKANDFAEQMDFRFLFDEERKLFTVGFNATANRRDTSFYDLLASESRLASFFAIAKGEVPTEHWFRMQRRFTFVANRPLLISWSGSMFEYLMPTLLLREYPHTLLEATDRAAVEVQKQYAARRRCPWGISESAYNERDLQMNYQYGPFGVPRLALRRSAPEELVVAPYATCLALEQDPSSACDNLNRLEAEGALGEFGYFESIDYTVSRLPPHADRAVLRTHMAHHQGMILVAIDNALNAGAMRERFHSDPAVQAAELLLQERIPRHAAALARASALAPGARPVVREEPAPAPRRFETPDSPRPRAHLLSNGSYSLMLTAAGSGWSRRGALALTRWREDSTTDSWGTWIYLRDVRTGLLWSSGHHPTIRRPRKYEARFFEHRAEISRLDADIETLTEIVVSPEDDAELRRVSLTNTSSRSRDVRDIEVTSYAEIVLARPEDDRAHPAFSNLFVETEAAGTALVCRRRPRSSEEAPLFAVHSMALEGQALGTPQHETDRARFLGRGRTSRAPAALAEDRPLSNTTGAVLDPIVSWRQRLRLGPGETARVVFMTAFAESREAALALAQRYRDPADFDRVSSLAWMRSQVVLHHFDITPEEANLFQRLASRVIYGEDRSGVSPASASPELRPKRSLWPYGISGDLPIVLVRIQDIPEVDLARQLLRAHEFWRFKGLAADLVILNEDMSGYFQPLQEQLADILRASPSHHLADKPGGIFLRRAELIPEADRRLLQSLARVTVVGSRGTLGEQLDLAAAAAEALEPIAPAVATPPRPLPPAAPREKLAYFNGIGGFSSERNQYVIVLNQDQWTPAPWINVVANPEFGFFVSESGSGPVWAGNSHENRLTSWSNDSVSDPPCETLYLRDEETGEIWTPTPLPIREPEPYVCRHGQGYSIFEHTSRGIELTLELFVPPEDPVKISRLRIRNVSGLPRKISATYYVEWVLGVDRATSAALLVTEVDSETGALFARNPASEDFPGAVAFADIGSGEGSFTGDRREFLGRDGHAGSPAALRRKRLSNTVGAGLDPCAALRRTFDLAAGESREIVLQLGQASGKAEASALVRKYRAPGAAAAARETAVRRWDEILGQLQVRTPDAALDTILNRWLLYQTISCRIWARTGFYQSSGAYGFRDQLQDVMAVAASAPSIAREHLLRAAARQFAEGDVQHWWHPPSGKGVRTRISDDRLWLPFSLAHYLEVTGDFGILDETVPYLDAPMVPAGESELYQEPGSGSASASLLDHCRRAIDASLAVGDHGLPLFGSGDWNDGLNRVGIEGRGESVWLAWFLHATLARFAPIIQAQGDSSLAERYRERAEILRQSIEKHSWDGDWYRRGYYDDGTALGSAANEECRIDSIAQSWAVLSGAADRVRAHRAMVAVDEYLVRRDDGLVLLLAPPFDRGPLDPGYIKGYLPGIRENGGQYTHAGVWAAMAFASLGDGGRAAELLGMLNPITHTSARTALHKYKTEPFATTGDVYSVAPHTGRGGWTWYTGSAGWMYRAGLESLLGFHLFPDRFEIDPCIPRGWPGFEILYRDGETRYEIRVENPDGISRGQAEIALDGENLPDRQVSRARDGQKHEVRVRMKE
jgi:cyclic beta-1,2-glucan synthetase